MSPPLEGATPPSEKTRGERHVGGSSLINSTSFSSCIQAQFLSKSAHELCVFFERYELIQSQAVEAISRRPYLAGQS